MSSELKTIETPDGTVEYFVYKCGHCELQTLKPSGGWINFHQDFYELRHQFPAREEMMIKEACGNLLFCSFRCARQGVDDFLYWMMNLKKTYELQESEKGK
jgi:hypothetical protein